MFRSLLDTVLGTNKKQQELLQDPGVVANYYQESVSCTEQDRSNANRFLERFVNVRCSQITRFDIFFDTAKTIGRNQVIKCIYKQLRNVGYPSVMEAFTPIG